MTTLNKFDLLDEEHEDVGGLIDKLAKEKIEQEKKDKAAAKAAAVADGEFARRFYAKVS